MHAPIMTILAFVAVPAVAETVVAPPAIRVVGHGSVETPPDIAVITYVLRGEGATSDDAVLTLVSKREPTDSALTGKAEVQTGKLAVNAARDKACDGDDDYDERTRLSSGVCTIKGYVATMSVTAKVKPVADAGTLLGLIGRLGASDPSLENFALSEPAAAQRAAIAAAVRDARQQASAIAAASGVALGRLRRVEDARAQSVNADDIVVTANRAPPEVTPPPIKVTLSPEPIETSATLNVEFEIDGSAIP